MIEVEMSRHVFRSWWEDHDPELFGDTFEDLLSAKIITEEDYLWQEYPTFMNGIDNDGPDGVFTWMPIGWNCWNMYENGMRTGVVIDMVKVYRAKVK